MVKLKQIITEMIKVVIIFLITFSIFLYGVSMMRNEYQQQLRHIEPEKAAEQVNLFKFFLN
ncbi:MAG TPA: hypothetical protein GXZ58_08815 [Bacilli bacterium]|uniref:Uncharacterized protein n=1 Tax=Amphibacillus indicireducens TaxID=1076330 RepID=A0ABP7VFH7_9BACI|nr:hypothetical protein [Bacilli bacterium]